MDHPPQATVGRAGPAPALLQALRFLLADEVAAGAGPRAFASAGSPEAEARVAALLVAAARAELERMDTSVAQVSNTCVLLSACSECLPRHMWGESWSYFGHRVSGV